MNNWDNSGTSQTQLGVPSIGESIKTDEFETSYIQEIFKRLYEVRGKSGSLKKLAKDKKVAYYEGNMVDSKCVEDKPVSMSLIDDIMKVIREIEDDVEETRSFVNAI